MVNLKNINKSLTSIKHYFLVNCVPVAPFLAYWICFSIGIGFTYLYIPCGGGKKTRQGLNTSLGDCEIHYPCTSL